MLAFLRIRVHEQDTDGYKILACAMKYLQLYPQLQIIVESDGKGNIYWSVDMAFAVDNDTRGYTGARMSLGQQGTVLVGISTPPSKRFTFRAPLKQSY